jgi:hypothetical protein
MNADILEILDGTMPVGTKGTITLNTVVYIIESEELTPNFSESGTRDGKGRANKHRYVRQPYVLKLTLQLAASTTAYPPVGTRFTYAVKNETTPVDFFVLTVPEKRTNEESFIESIEIECRQTLNTSAFSVVTA